MKNEEKREALALSVPQLAEQLGISLPIAYQLVKSEGFPAIRVSERRIIIPKDALEKWLSQEAD